MITIQGKVVSAKMQDTVVVEVSRTFPHPKYSKQITRHTKYHAHTTLKLAEGDEVLLKQIKPVSKTKSWEVVKKI